MVRLRQSESGQLLVPMVLLMLLFAAFAAGYIGWCRAVYWQMRMDMVAEAVAISAARAQAAMLNNIATLQDAENIFLHQAKIFSSHYAEMGIELKGDFDSSNIALAGMVRGFNGQTMLVAQSVARANGVKIPAVPYPKPDHHLEPQEVYTIFVWKVPPFLTEQTYDKAYYVRKWGGGRLNVQPDHEVTWGVMKNGIVGTATARLWLDVSPGAWWTNGGFPGEDLPWYRNLGIQCFYPQFNARLVRASTVSDQIIRHILKGI